MRLAIIVLLTLVPGGAAAGDIASHRKQAMAVENIELARTHCGHELTARAALLIAADHRAEPRPFAEERAVLDNLWRQTWACNPAFTSGSCMAARLQLCHRAYTEYGPEGVRLKGLIRAIVKK